MKPKRRASTRWDDLKWWAIGLTLMTLIIIWGIVWVYSWGRGL